jgi:alpha-glucuronidase
MTIGRFALRRKIDFFLALGLALAITVVAAHAQSADQAWLREPSQLALFGGAIALGNSPIEQSALQELKRSISSPTPAGSHANSLTVIGTAAEVHKAYPRFPVPSNLAPGAYWIWDNGSDEHNVTVIAGGDDRGALYGVFALLRYPLSGMTDPPEKLPPLHLHPLRSAPAMPIRWVDEWDNANGTVERGYGSSSIFFDNGHVRDDLSQVSEYARLLASVGINGCDVDNVNGAAPFLTDEWLHGLARIADAMRPWGVHLAMSVDIASPQKIGGLKTFDPLDPAVKAWWADKVNEIYKLIPDLAGFTVKADSEGQPGPASYGRSPADAANVLAAALTPHGGVVLYRAFVYNNHLDYNDLKADRARAAYDIFHPLDGKFLPNVIVQIKEGPIDFQAQEPVSPLFAGLRKTNEAMELQITQEYLGQQRHLVYIAPMWKWVLDFDMRAENRATPVKEIIEGKSFHRPLGGMIGDSCVGRDWLGAPLAMANLYAFGRLAWDPNLSAQQIAEEWTRQTIGTDPQVVGTVTKMLMQSWPAYLHYTGFLGTQTLTDITGSHYGPNIESSEGNGWGQWHRDDAKGIGMDRTVATGTGFIGQYPPEIAKMYESTATTPDDLLLFFHHVPWTYKLHSGKTVIQYVYDIHYQGAEEAARLVNEWETLKGKIDPALYNDELARLRYQAGHAIVWRDAIVQYFLKESGIPDAQGRAGHFPGRMEAEDARLTGYKVFDVTPWEDASGGKAVACGPVITPSRDFFLHRDETPVPEKSFTCSAEWSYTGAAGRFNIAVQYFDLQGGEAHFRLEVNGKPAASWAADAHLPSFWPNGDNSTRYTAPDIELKPGDVLNVEGISDGRDPAALDYIEIDPVAAASASAAHVQGPPA